MGLGYWHIWDMRRPDLSSPRHVLSRNVRALMDMRPDLDTIRKVVKASGTRLSNGKVGRITTASHATDIDTLQALADVFGVQPWQLLVRDLNPHALPRLVDAEVLNQLMDVVAGRTAMPEEGKPAAPAPRQPEHFPSVDPKIGPALRRATRMQGEEDSERRRPQDIPKPARSSRSS